MPNLKDIKTRIESVKKTRQITQAMKLVAGAKLKRATDAATSARPYNCLLYTSPSPRDKRQSRMPSSA